MNENSETSREPETGIATNKGRTKKPIVVTVVAVIAIVGVAFVAWLLWPGKAGKPVPVPRSVSFEETPSQQAAMSGDQKLTLSPEQVQRAGLKIEKVGESPASEATSQMTTGIVQPNIYKETPVASLVGGIVRSVSAQLGQNVRRGQQVAVVFSNELAEAQSDYLKALAELDEHHRHHTRTVKLVEIGAASREELEIANTKLRDAESNVANLRQKLLLLGLSSQRVNSLISTSQVSSEVTVVAPSNGTVTAARSIPVK